MALWTAGCSAESNLQLVQNLKNAGLIQTMEVIDAMMQTDRALYVPSIDPKKCKSLKYHYGPYADAPQSIGSKVTISAPYIHATVLELLHTNICRPSCRILDVGCGSGILLAYMARMSNSFELIVGIDIVPELVTMTGVNLKMDGLEKLLDDRIVVRQGDGWEGAPELGPFDAILVDASAAQIPMKLVEQLKPGGALVLPLGPPERGSQVLTKVIKHATSDLDHYRNDCDTDTIARTRNNVNAFAGAEREGVGAFFLEQIPLTAVRFVPLVLPIPKPSRPSMGVLGAESMGSIQGGQRAHKEGGAVDWDARYKAGWAYGQQPNGFLAQAMACHCAHMAPSHSRVLSLGEGQGRNVVHLALQGFHCIAVDSSAVALAKTRKLAKSKDVLHLVSTVLADLARFDVVSFSGSVRDEAEGGAHVGTSTRDGDGDGDGGGGGFDVIVSVFFMLPPTERVALHRRCAQALRPGGVIIIHCFSPEQASLQHNPKPILQSNSKEGEEGIGQGKEFHEDADAERSAVSSKGGEAKGGEKGVECGSREGPRRMGPPPECLVSCEHLREDFAGLGMEELHAAQTEQLLREGSFHRGRACLTEFVVRRPLHQQGLTLPPKCDKSRGPSADPVLAVHMCAGADDADADGAGDSAGVVTPASYRRSVDEVFAWAQKAGEEEEEEEEGSDDRDGIGGCSVGKKQKDVFGDATGDIQLGHAANILRDACEVARRARWCRYCWTPPEHCYCLPLQAIIDVGVSACSSPLLNEGSVLMGNDAIEGVRLPLPEPAGAASSPFGCPYVHWVFVSHPSEFLRSTSSATIAAQFLARLPLNTCSYLVFGCAPHMRRLDRIISACETTPSFLLFPEYDQEGIAVSSSPDVKHECRNTRQSSQMDPPLFPPHLCSSGPQSCTSQSSHERETSNGDREASPSPIGKGEEDYRSGDVDVFASVRALCKKGYAGEGSEVTIIVPDGSWQCAGALVTWLRLRLRQQRQTGGNRNGDGNADGDCERGENVASALRNLTLDNAHVSRHFSPLIEALKAGQGLGRLSTLEACAMLLRRLHDECEGPGHRGSNRGQRDQGDPPLEKESVEGHDLSRSGTTILEDDGGVTDGSHGDHVADRLERCLDPLVAYVETAITRRRQQVDDGEDEMKAAVVAGQVDEKGWVDALQRCASKMALIPVPIGLRTCVLCGENLATPSRMQQHLKGRRHAEVTARRFFKLHATTPPGDVIPLVPDDAQSRSIIEECSGRFIRECQPEPPDVALVKLKTALGTRARFPAAGAAQSKGEQLIVRVPEPRPAAPLPKHMRARWVVGFDTASLDLRGRASDLLLRCSNIGAFKSNAEATAEQGEERRSGGRLEDFRPQMNIFRSFKSRQVLYNAVKEDAAFLCVYEQMVRTVCCPFLKHHLFRASTVSKVASCRMATEDEEVEEVEEVEERSHPIIGALRFHYQYPPTLRIQAGPSEEHGRTHRDLEYGHQEGEINFWMPLTDVTLTNTTLWVESAPDVGDFAPLDITYGAIGVFHGTLCRHFAPMNSTDCTRISLDFRIGIGPYFDDGWEFKEAKGKHGRRSFDL